MAKRISLLMILWVFLLSITNEDYNAVIAGVMSFLLIKLITEQE